MENNNDLYLDTVRKEHRENSQTFFVEILNTLWGDRNEEETLSEWRRLCSKVRWYAEDALECMDRILAEPPYNLAELMQNEGSIMLASGPAPYTVIHLYRQKYYDFLLDTSQKFRKIFEEIWAENG